MSTAAHTSKDVRFLSVISALGQDLGQHVQNCAGRGIGHQRPLYKLVDSNAIELREDFSVGRMRLFFRRVNWNVESRVAQALETLREPTVGTLESPRDISH